MGNLTTITLYNDHYHRLDEDPERFIKDVKRAMEGGGRINYTGIIAQKPRHADHHGVYVHMGNTVVDMDAFGQKAQKLVENNTEFFDDLVDYLESNLNRLKMLKMLKLKSNEK